MKKYLLRKVLQSFVLLILILLLNFIILRLTPGDPLTTALYNNGRPLNNTQQRYTVELKKRMGVYIDPLPTAFLNWIGGVVRFDFGYSIRDGKPITPQLVEAAQGSFWLFLFSLLLGLGLGVPLGIYAAYHYGTWKDKLIQIGTVIFLTLPGWFMILLIYFLNQQVWLASNKTFSFIPIFTPDANLSSFVLGLGHFWAVFLPVFFLAVIFMALFATQIRSQVLEVLHQDYVRTARAKGLSGLKVLWRHVLKNSITPLVSLLGGLIPFAFGVQILIESVSYWFGLGSLFLSAASAREYTTLMGVFTFLAVISIFFSLLADIIRALIDPKVRDSMR